MGSKNIDFRISQRILLFLSAFLADLQEGTQKSEISKINKSTKVFSNFKRTQISEISTAPKPTKLSILKFQDFEIAHLGLGCFRNFYDLGALYISVYFGQFLY